VAKKSKKEAEKQVNGSAATEAKATSATPKSKVKKVTPKKKSVTPKSVAPKKTSIREPSDDEIRTRAYFIAERRMQLSLQGDSAHDWIEARRQLIEEARATSS
jgi:hypothetical protein